MWATKFFEFLKQLADTFNTGRLIFYTAAGMAVMVPFSMIVKLLAEDTVSKKSLFPLLAAHAEASITATTFVIANLVGFLIAIIGFELTLKPISKSGKLTEATAAERKKSFSYLYPFLRGNKTEDYHAWLISEYYRFVEIATYIPLGLMTGVTLLFLYCFIYIQLLPANHANLDAAYNGLFIFGISALLLWFVIWPMIWKRKVLTNLVASHQNAKLALWEGVRDYRKIK